MFATNAPTGPTGTIAAVIDDTATPTQTPTAAPAPKPLGAIYLPASGTGVGEFQFVVDPENGSAVEISTPVAADTSEGTVVGVVTDMSTVGTSRDPVREEMGTSYDSNYIKRSEEVIVATVQVYASEKMRSIRAGVVRPATAAELLTATGMDRMDWPIPAGVLGLADGGYAKVCFDGPALLGPESSHLIVNGLSGQAAKTSLAGVLLRSVMAHSNKTDKKVAALVFNVKGQDMIFMDKAPTTGYELSEADVKMYDALGIPATPFDDVEVWAPGLPGGASGTQSRREDAQMLRWDLHDIWPYLRHFFPMWYEDEKLQSFLAEFEEAHLYNKSPRARIDSFAALDNWFNAHIADADEKSAMAWRSHHVATLRRIRRMLMGVVPRCRGLIVRDKTTSAEDIPVDAFRAGQVLVVDIAGLRSDVQSIVIARTLERVLEQAEEGDLGVDNLIVFADELNQWAPSSAPEAPQVRKLLQRVATQGRYAGISMWGACQKMSKIDELVRDNAATRAVGITSEGELSSGAYGRLSAGLTERLATLPKGQMALWHYTFRGAMVVSFPRPAWQTGKAKATGEPAPRRKRGVDTLEVSERGLDRLLEGVPSEVAEQIIAASDDAGVAAAELAKVRVPDMSKVMLHEPSTVDLNNPFDLSDDD